jgi:hypothetical protein
MTLTLNGSANTISGLAVGGLPDGIVDADMIGAKAATAGKLANGAIVQVLQAFKSDNYSRTSDGTSTTIPGLSVAITMTAASNKVLCIAQVQATAGGNYGGHVLNLVRGTTKIGQAEAHGSRTLGSVGMTPSDNYSTSRVINYLDTPGTGTHTYAVQDYDPSSSNVIYVNRSITDSDDAGYQRTASSLIIMEVVA